MRVYGRVTDEYGNKSWVVVQTDPNGLNDYVYVTAMIQEIKLNLGESPFWANRGIPAHLSVVQQVPPDYYTALIQQRYAPLFSALSIVRQPDNVSNTGRYAPTYQVNVLTHRGVQLEAEVPV